jgi:hypothetical protein
MEVFSRALLGTQTPQERRRVPVITRQLALICVVNHQQFLIPRDVLRIHLVSKAMPAAAPVELAFELAAKAK